MSPIESLRACKYLYLHDIGEPNDNELRLVVHEARVGGSVSEQVLNSEQHPEVRKLLSESSAIEHGPGCKVFEIVWGSYVGYSVLNESFVLPEPEASKGVGRLLVEYESSVFLEYLARATFAAADYPGPFKHWALYCLNHSVNVASAEEPKIAVRVAA